MMTRRLALVLAAFLALAGATAAWADVIHLTNGGKYRGRIVTETTRAVTIETTGGKVVVPRDEIAQIVREEDAKSEFQRRYDELKRSPDPDRYYELGVWAQEKELDKRARSCFLRAIEVDAFHERSRVA